jgi:glycosyltransferase involved in cell wall biosynthesis
MKKLSASRPQASVIVAVYKNPWFLELVLESLKRQTFRDFEVLIADDGSGPDIARLLKRVGSSCFFPIRHVWHADKGFRKTVIANKAVRQASSDYLLFIDGDTLLHHAFVGNHLRFRQKGVVLTGRRINLHQKVTKRVMLEDVRSGRYEKPVFWLPGVEGHQIKHGLYLPASFHVENFVRRKYSVLGCNFSMFKDDYLAINGYDERIIGRGLEDSNLYVRILLHGLKVKTLARQALQYHLYHPFDPKPHSPEVVKAFCSVDSAWTPYGLAKNPKIRRVV